MVYETKNLLTSLKRELDIQKLKEDRLVHLACHDALTGLPNRALFKARLKLEIAHAKRDRKKVAVMMLDLDHFKTVNDTLNHSMGDQLLKCVGQRLKSLLRDSDTVARFGGDEFVLLAPDLLTKDDAETLVKKILDAVRKPYHLDGHRIVISASLGISYCPDDGDDVDDLMKKADIALYMAKERGRNTYAFYTEMDALESVAEYSDRLWQYQYLRGHVLPLLRRRLN
jgi:diguanylate cyclase (GGDEF)-like protein